MKAIINSRINQRKQIYDIVLTLHPCLVWLHQECITHTISDHKMIHLWHLSEVGGHPNSISPMSIDMWLGEARNQRERSSNNAGNPRNTTRRVTTSINITVVIPSSMHALIRYSRTFLHVPQISSQNHQHTPHFSFCLVSMFLGMVIWASVNLRNFLDSWIWGRS